MSLVRPRGGVGIDAVHIYGCTSTCEFWGAATYGVPRPDVAAAHGAQYLNAGYTLTKAGLTPGGYYVQIHAKAGSSRASYPLHPSYLRSRERFRYAGYTITGSLLAGPHLIGASARSSHTQVWTVRTRTIYVDTPTVPLTIDRLGTGTGGVTASGLTCVGLQVRRVR